MSEREPNHESPVTADEVEAAEHLAWALEGGDTEPADPEALAAARLLQALAAPGDELARHRQRADLVGKARAAHSARLGRRYLAAAALAGVALLAGLLLRGTSDRSEALLAEREAHASRAVNAVSSGWTVDGALSSRLGSVFDEQWRSRLQAQVTGQRATALATFEAGSTRPTSPSSAPPGGTS